MGRAILPVSTAVRLSLPQPHTTLKMTLVPQSPILTRSPFKSSSARLPAPPTPSLARLPGSPSSWPQCTTNTVCSLPSVPWAVSGVAWPPPGLKAIAGLKQRPTRLIQSHAGLQAQPNPRILCSHIPSTAPPFPTLLLRATAHLWHEPCLGAFSLP